MDLSHVIPGISRTRTKRHRDSHRLEEEERTLQAGARARGGGRGEEERRGGGATSGHARPRNIKDTPNAASCRSFVLAPLDVHAHLALISTPRPRRCYPLRDSIPGHHRTFRPARSRGPNKGSHPGHADEVRPSCVHPYDFHGF